MRVDFNGVGVLIGSTNVSTIESDGAWGGVDVNFTGTILSIRVIGKAATTITWHTETIINQFASGF